MVPTVTPSASTQMVRVCCPLTFMGLAGASLAQVAAEDKAGSCALIACRACHDHPRSDSGYRWGAWAMSVDYEAEYNTRARVPDPPEIFARWEREAAAYRER